MEMERLLGRCRDLEERAGAVYRTWAARTRESPRLCSLWTALAREEEEHARSLRVALRSPAPSSRNCLDVAGWEDAIAAVEERLIAAESLGEGATADHMLATALELEMTELDTMRRALVGLAGRPVGYGEDHAAGLAREATKFTNDPHVGVLAALLLAETQVRRTG
jgi:rubrerythrin